MLSLVIFNKIEQLIGIGIERNNLTLIKNLFDWLEEEITGLSQLKGIEIRDILEDTKYKPICYLFEAAYALVIERRRNISGNPGCKW